MSSIGPSNFIAGNAGPGISVKDRQLDSPPKPGAIHHMRGDVFVPGAALSAIVKKLRAYDTHVDLFSPTIRVSALCGKEGENVFVFRYWATPYIDSITETRATHRRVDDKRYVVTSQTTGMGGPGDLPDRANLCQGDLPGVFYMNQLHAVWRYEQTPDGVRIEAEAVAELSGFALVRTTVRRTLTQILSRSLEQYRTKFATPR